MSSIRSCWTSSTSAKGGICSSGADSSVDAVDDLDCVRECHCRWSPKCTVSQVGSSKPRTRPAQQKSEMVMSNAGFLSRNCSVASRDCSLVTLSGAT